MWSSNSVSVVLRPKYMDLTILSSAYVMLTRPLRCPLWRRIWTSPSSDCVNARITDGLSDQISWYDGCGIAERITCRDKFHFLRIITARCYA